MKRYYFLLMALLLMVGCTKSETDTAVTQQLQNSPDFYATFESDDTRTFVDEKVRLLWTEGDQLSIFTSTLNQKYEFDGETGDNSGTFTPISSGQFGSGSSLSVDANFAVYPYNQSTKISYDGDLSIELPSTQAYAEDSFGVNANTMVAATKSQNDYFLSFKNLGGFLKLQLYGDVTVKSIQLKGNSGEKIAGAATVVAKSGKNPTLTMSNTATDAITLDCGAGVKLGTSSSSATEFWIVVPPVTFTKGFTITITDTEGGTMTKSTSKSYTVERNVMKSMTAFEVETELLIPTNEIWYTSTDGKVVELSPNYYYNDNSSFGADIVSNVYENGKGVITFDGEVTEVAISAFYHNPYNEQESNLLLSVVLPNSVKKIGNNAFQNQTSLTTITIPNGITEIGEFAFSACESLADVKIPNSVTKIGSSAFGYNPSLKSITLPSITDIAYNTFTGCDNLTEINGEYASADKRSWIVDGTLKLFLPAGLTEYTIPNSVTTIGDSVFSYCEKLTNITIPNGVKTIGAGAFAGCTGLTSVNLPNSVTEIGDGAFRGCTGIESFTIPDSVTISANFLNGCTNLRSIYGKNASSDNRCWIVDDELLIFAPAGLTQYAIPEGVKIIGRGAFNYCSALTSVTIPNSVTKIGITAFANCRSLSSINIPDGVTSIGNSAFQSCYALTEITIPDSVTDFGKSLFTLCRSLKKVTLPKNLTKIEYYTFDSCEALTDVKIPDSVTEIGERAFSLCKSLSIINIPEGVTSIGSTAFMECYALTNITLPSTLQQIGYMAFGNCRALTTIYSKAVTPPSLYDVNTFSGANVSTVFVPTESVEAYESIEWGKWHNRIPTYVGWDFSTNDSTENLEIHYTTTDGNIITFPQNYDYIDKFGASIKSHTYENGEGVITLNGYVAYVAPFIFATQARLKSITLPKGIASIGEWGFTGCQNLEEIILPERLLSIGENTFGGCHSLESITIPNDVTYIGPDAFSQCIKLANITLSNNLTKIEDCMFYECESLENITIPASVKEIGYRVFMECPNLKNVTLSEGLIQIGRQAFEKCNGITSIDIPNSVTEISAGAFSQCANLENIVLSENLEKIGGYAFQLCEKLNSITLPEKLKEIGSMAFGSTYALTIVNSKSTIPPMADGAVFDYGSTNLTIYVPTESVDAYKAADGWKEYESIIQGKDFE